MTHTSRFDWERAFRDRGPSDPKVRLVGLVAATYASADGTDVRPGLARLVAGSSLGRRTVTRALVALTRSGWLDVAQQHTFTTPTVYRLALPPVVSVTTPCGQPDYTPVVTVTPPCSHSDVLPVQDQITTSTGPDQGEPSPSVSTSATPTGERRAHLDGEPEHRQPPTGTTDGDGSGEEVEAESGPSGGPVEGDVWALAESSPVGLVEVEEVEESSPHPAVAEAAPAPGVRRLVVPSATAAAAADVEPEVEQSSAADLDPERRRLSDRIADRQRRAAGVGALLAPSPRSRYGRTA